MRAVLFSIQIVEHAEFGRCAYLLPGFVSPFIECLSIELVHFFVAARNIVAVAITCRFRIRSEQFLFRVFEECEGIFPPVAGIQIFDSHIRVVFQSQIVSDLEEIVVCAIWLYAERHTCQPGLQLMSGIEFVADPAGFQHGAARRLCIEAEIHIQ